jgi:phage portal protein BeeE
VADNLPAVPEPSIYDPTAPPTTASLNDVAKWRRLMGNWLGGWAARILPPDFGRLPTTPSGTAGVNGATYQPNDAGVSFTDARALSVSTVFSCVRLLAETVATMPLILYKRMPDGSRQRATDHPAFALMADAPNPQMTALELREALTAQLVLYGNAYAQLVRNGNGDVVTIYPLRADRMLVIRQRDGTAVYMYQLIVETTYLTAAGVPPSALSNVNVQGPVPTMPAWVALSPNTVLHIKGFGADGYIGYSPLAYASNALGLTVASEHFAGSFYSRGGKPSGVLMMDRLLSKEQRAQVRSEFGNMSTYDGGRLWVLEASMKYQPISIAPDEAQLLESRRFQAVEIARFFRVPPHLIFEMEKATTWGTGLEQQNLAFLAYSLMPYLRRWETAAAKYLLNDDDRKVYYFEHLLDALLRADSAARAALYQSYTVNGIMTRDEVRRAENLPAKGGQADVLTVMSNLIPLDKVNENAALRATTPAPA